MIRAGVGISRQASGRAAAEEAVAGALAGLERPDAALIFAGPGYAAELPGLLDTAVAALGCSRVAGATAHGVLGCGQELEEPAALVVLAWQGLEAEAFLLGDAQLGAEAACHEIAACLGGEPSERDLVVLLPDPRSFDPARFLPQLERTLGPARVVGAGAADPLSDEPLLWAGRDVASGGIAGMVLRGQRPARIGVTQACRPTTGLLTVTRCRGHWVQELDGRPALEVFREAAGGALAEDLPRAAAFVLVALPVEPGSERLAPGSYRVRHLIGIEPEANAFAIPEPVSPGARLALAIREPQAAREDLKAMLEQVAGPPPPAFGLYFDCCARGAGFFGVSGLEAGYLESALGATPIAGMFGSCELGPLVGRTELLTYTGVLALLEA